MQADESVNVAATPPSLSLFGSTSNLVQQFARYLVVGGMAFVVDFGSLWLLTEKAKIHYLVSAAIAFLAGLLLNYYLSHHWVFDKRTIQNGTLEFVIFAAIGGVGLMMNELIIWSLHDKVHLHYMFAKAISAGIVLIWNFGARKYMLFR